MALEGEVLDIQQPTAKNKRSNVHESTSLSCCTVARLQVSRGREWIEAALLREHVKQTNWQCSEMVMLV